MATEHPVGFGEAFILNQDYLENYFCLFVFNDSDCFRILHYFLIQDSRFIEAEHWT